MDVPVEGWSKMDGGVFLEDEMNLSKDTGDRDKAETSCNSLMDMELRLRLTLSSVGTTSRN